MANSDYNPDVLNCLANLSNDEVFTPPVLANQMLDLLPQELFSNPKTTFLDPFCKSGVFLREIVKRLDVGLQDTMPDRKQRIDHILHHQVFGIAITELTAYLSRRSVYCSRKADGPHSVSRFNTPDGNIRYKPLHHTWEQGKCKYCGASQAVYDRGDQSEQYAYQFIHTDNPEKIFNMKFDVIIGNPPYQLSDGGGMQTESSSGSAIPLYHKFVEQAQLLDPRFLLMIIPSRWFSGGRGLDSFREKMLQDNRLSVLVDFLDSRDCFPGVDIAGGVCYFLWERDKVSNECKTITNSINGEESMIRKLGEYGVYIRYPKALSIIKKVKKFEEKCMDEVVYSSKPFGFRSFERGKQHKFDNSIALYGSNGYTYVKESEVTINKNLINDWKLIMSKTSAEHAGQSDKDGRRKIVSRIMILEPQEICSESYLLLSTFYDKEGAENMKTYFKTAFSRFLMAQVVLTQNMSKTSFKFVPLQDFSHPWTDEMLYKKYNLTQEEIAFIESMIRPME